MGEVLLSCAQQVRPLTLPPPDTVLLDIMSPLPTFSGTSAFCHTECDVLKLVGRLREGLVVVPCTYSRHSSVRHAATQCTACRRCLSLVAPLRFARECAAYSSSSEAFGQRQEVRLKAGNGGKLHTAVCVGSTRLDKLINLLRESRESFYPHLAAKLICFSGVVLQRSDGEP